MVMRNFLGASLLAITMATPVWAQTAPPAAPPQTADDATSSSADAFGTDIVVTAQRQSQRLQEVPIAVSAF